MMDFTAMLAGNDASMSGLQKAALICVTLGEDFAHDVMRSLDEAEQEKLTLAIAQSAAVGREGSEPIVREFNALMQGAEWLSEGGLDYARKLLEDTVGKTKADEILRRIQKDLDDTGLNRLRKADPDQLRQVLRNEHPQTIALIMAHLDPRQCSAVIEKDFEMEFAADILYRIARMEKVSPEMLEIVENALGDQALNLSTQMSVAGGPAHVAEVLNNTGGSMEKELLDHITAENPELSMEIKNMMFVFEDILRLDDRALQQVLQQVEVKDLATALKVATEELTARIMANMSQRAAENLKEEQEMLGPVRVRNVDEAQARVIGIIRSLEEAGEIELATGGEGDELV